MQYEKMLDPEFRRVDQRTGEQVPLTDEQREGIQRQYDTMLQNPNVRKQYVNAKVQEDQVRRMQQAQADEGKIAESSKNIFSAESEDKVDEALQAALNDPDLSPAARQAVVQQANAQTAFLGRKAERAERAAELKTPVITKEEYDTQRGSIDAMPDSPAKTRLLASLEGVYETQQKIDKGGIGFASKSAREQVAKTMNKVDQQVIAFEAAELASQRQLKQSEDNRNAATYQEAKINAAMGPAQRDVSSYMKAQEEAGNSLTYEQAEAVLQAQLEETVNRVRPLVAPEEQEKVEAERSAAEKAARARPLPEGVAPESAQATALYRVRAIYPDASDAEIIASMQKQGKWPKGGSEGPVPFGALTGDRKTGAVTGFVGEMFDNFMKPRTVPTPAEAAEQERFRNRNR
jgi:hypothetical protein